MARVIGPDQQYRVFYYTSGSKAGQLIPPGTPVPLYADDQGSIPADVLGLDNSPIAGTPPTVLISALYEVPQFKYPDGVKVVYTRVLGGPVVPLYAMADDRLDVLEAAVASLQPGGSDEAATAADLEALATTVGGKANDLDVVHDTGAETIAGIKTFSSSPVVPTPSTNTQAANKGYVDTATVKPTGLVYSKVATDGTDQKAVLDAEIAALLAAGGGTLILPTGTIRYDGAMTLPNDGATPPKQASLVIRGQGAHWSGRGTAVIGGTTLDLRGTATYGKILTTGLGLLTMQDLTLRDTAGTTTPFLYTTNTTLMLQRVAFVGSKTGTANDQDAIILGGTQAVEGQGNPDHGFQGYGTVIKECFFSSIRRAVVTRVYANAVIVRDNTVWGTCGNAAGGAIEWDGGAPGTTGALIEGNLIELPNYQYGIKMANAQRCVIVGNGMYDATGTTLAAVRFESTARYNLLVEGLLAAGLTGVSDASVSDTNNPTNTVITSGQSAYSHSAGPLKITASVLSEILGLKITGGPDKFIVQPAVSTGDTARLLWIRRSAAEASQPGADVWYVQQQGNIVAQGTFAGNQTYRDAAGTTVVTWTNNGKTWAASAAGGPMVIDSGTGGSYVTVKCLALKLLKQDGVYTATLLPITGTPEGGASTNAQAVGSLAMRSDGTAATGVLYVKETGGATNLGWIPALTRTGLWIIEGANARQGVATLVAGTVTVANTSVTANSRIMLTVQSLGTVTTPKAIAVTARVNGTSFTITSADNTDTSVVAYQISEPG